MDGQMEKKKIMGLSPNVAVLGGVSLFTDISSEMLYPLVPIFLTTVLGAPVAALGLIEGAAEGTANVLKIFSGWWSDRTGRRKPFVIGGYGLSAFSKPLLALAAGWPFVLLMRLADRSGKGLRSAARDALIADYTGEKDRGKAFGLHRAMDSMGAVLGPLLALWFMSHYGESPEAYRKVFLWAFLPAALGVMLLFIVKERPFSAKFKKPSFGWGIFNKDLKVFLLVNLVFYLGNSSDAFLILRAKDMGLSMVTVILAYVLYNLVYSLASLPAGILADRLGKRRVFFIGLLVFSAVYFGFALLGDPKWIWMLFAVYGLYTAMTDGVGKAYVSVLVGESHRATALGAYNMIAGLAGFLASLAAGLLWTALGPQAAFIYGGAAAALAAALFWVLVKRETSH
jgi:MFS family permease